MSALKRVERWLDPKLEWPDDHEVWIGGMMSVTLRDLREVVRLAKLGAALEKWHGPMPSPSVSTAKRPKPARAKRGRR